MSHTAEEDTITCLDAMSGIVRTMIGVGQMSMAGVLTWQQGDGATSTRRLGGENLLAVCWDHWNRPVKQLYH